MTVVNMLARAALGLRFNEHIDEDGPIVSSVTRAGPEGIVSKRKDVDVPLRPLAA